MGKGAKSTEASKMPTDFWIRYTDEVRLLYAILFWMLECSDLL